DRVRERRQRRRDAGPPGSAVRPGREPEDRRPRRQLRRGRGALCRLRARARRAGGDSRRGRAERPGRHPASARAARAGARRGERPAARAEGGVPLARPPLAHRELAHRTGDRRPGARLRVRSQGLPARSAGGRAAPARHEPLPARSAGRRAVARRRGVGERPPPQLRAVALRALAHLRRAARSPRAADPGQASAPRARLRTCARPRAGGPGRGHAARRPRRPRVAGGPGASTARGAGCGGGRLRDRPRRRALAARAGARCVPRAEDPVRAAGRVNVAVVGLGYWGTNLLRTFGALPAARVTGLCDLVPEHVGRSAEQHPGARGTTDYAELLGRADVDAVVLATPPSRHHAIALPALPADMVVGDLELEGGVSAHIYLSWLHPEKTAKVTVIGRERMLSYEGRFEKRGITLFDYAIDRSMGNGDATAPVIPVSHFAARRLEVPAAAEPLALAAEHFVESVRSDTEPLTS